MRQLSACGLLSAVLLGALSGCAGGLLPAGDRGSAPTPTPSATGTTTVYGFVLITDPGMTAEKVAERRNRVYDSGDSSCVAPDGFEDIAAGGEVQVLGPDGVLATGTVQVGDWQSDVMSANNVNGCGFPIVIDDVPAGLDRYGIHVGSESRPAYAFTASEMRSGPRLFL
jgi:hypothetical protein